MDPQALQMLQALAQGQQTQQLDDQSPSLGLPYGGSMGMPTAQYQYSQPVAPQAPGQGGDMYSALMQPPPGTAPQPQWPPQQ